MSITNRSLPFSVRAGIFVVGLLALLVLLYFTRGFVVPFIFSVIFAIVLHPVVMFFVRHKFNRVIAIIVTMLLTTIVIVAIGALLISQLVRLSESWPIIVDKFTIAINEAITYVESYFDVNPQTVRDWIASNKGELLGMNTAAFGHTLVSLGNGVMILLLIPLYIFLLLFYQPLILDFIRRLFGRKNKIKINEIVSQVKTVIQQYLVGLAIEIVIVATLETLALLFLGIEYAILFGIVGALLNLIPYIGGLAAVALPMMMALVTKPSPWYAMYVLGLFYFIQLVDNNYIVPKIVASKVKINALFSILAVLAGNAIWGIAGMFLSIPLLAIVKLIFDRIEPLHPWGYLLGDTMPTTIKLKKGSK